MGKKSSPSMIPRFIGRTGKARLTDILCCQPISAGNVSVAKELVTHGQVVEVAAGTEIIEQGEADNDFYLIISGNFAVTINGRQVAERGPNTYVGEMALLDGTARRSATVTATECSVVLKLAERDVAKIAEKHPDVWRKMARELGARLRDRTRFIEQPNAQPSVFVGSTSESLDEAQYISDSLARQPIVSRLWTQGVFQLSRTALEGLLTVAKHADFAVLLITPDDTTISRGTTKPSPRDNVIFELGLFMGALGRERAFIVSPRGKTLKLPTDILGVTIVPYKAGGKGTITKRLTPAVRVISQTILELGPR